MGKKKKHRKTSRKVMEHLKPLSLLEAKMIFWVPSLGQK